MYTPLQTSILLYVNFNLLTTQKRLITFIMGISPASSINGNGRTTSHPIFDIPERPHRHGLHEHGWTPNRQ